MTEYMVSVEDYMRATLGQMQQAMRVMEQQRELQRECEYLKSEWAALDESRIAFVKEAYKLLGIEDDGEYRWKWVLLGIHSLKEELDEAVGLLESYYRTAKGDCGCDECQKIEAFLARRRAASQEAMK